MIILNRSSKLLKIFVLFSSIVMFLSFFVFLLICGRISSLSNQSSSNSGCEFLFSVMSIRNTTLILFLFSLSQCFAFEFYRNFVYVYESFFFISFFGVIIGGMIVIGIQYQQCSIGCPSAIGLLYRNLSG